MEQSNTSPSLIKNFGSPSGKPKMKIAVFISFILVAIVAGIGIGYLPKLFSKTDSTTKTTTENTKSAGIADKKTFKDSVEGTLKEGGIDGEGSYHLVRPGGESQNVYLTSTTVDLSTYIGKKVKVWGQTFQGQTAGWFMDVGYVESLK